MSTRSTNTRAIRERLETRRKSLLSRYRSAVERSDDDLAAPARPRNDDDDELWAAHVLLRMTDVDLRTLDCVVRALRRLDAGTYGICASCDERIEPARLAAIPEAAECVDCVRFADEMPLSWAASPEEARPRRAVRPASEPTA
jgi:DnaK suppressor protein